jgi:hypothetical protein
MPPVAEAPAPMATPEPGGPGAFVEGHPREGAFLAGPGSLAFIVHHTVMGGAGVLATQMVPRVLQSLEAKDSVWSNSDSRLAYLAGTLIGAGVGFGASAWWQFNHWINPSSATFGMINSLVGAMFAGGITNLFTTNATAISWLSLVGAELGAWLTTVIGTGELPFNKGTLIVSGAAWAAIYTALMLAVAATTGSGGSLRAGLDALLITPALGAAAMALATLKFNPSTAQIMRANLFGVGVGGAVLVLSALVLGPATGFASPIPYALAAVGAIGAKTVVSLLWAEAAEPPVRADAVGPQSRYRSLW